MSFLSTMLRKHLTTGLLIFGLLAWALTSTAMILRMKKETVLIGIDKNGTRIITKNDDPLYKTEVVNFIRRFVATLYNFDHDSFVENVGAASDLMTVQLWNQEKNKILKLGEVVKKEKISHTGLLQKISLANGKYQVLVETNEMVRMKNVKHVLKLDVELHQTDRTERNPWGMEVSNLVETKIN